MVGTPESSEDPAPVARSGDVRGFELHPGGGGAPGPEVPPPDPADLLPVHHGALIA